MKIAIDPAYDKNIAVAWSSDNEKIDWDVIQIPKEHTKAETRSLEKIAVLTVEYIKTNFDIKNATIVIEGQWFGRNVQVYGQLIALRSLIHGILITVEPTVHVEIVGPITWQSKILDKKIDSKDTTKVRSIKKAFEITNKTLTDDESDAVCMCKYAINYLK